MHTVASVLTKLQVLEAREMYAESANAAYALAQIAETFYVSRKTIWRHLDRSA